MQPVPIDFIRRRDTFSQALDTLAASVLARMSGLRRIGQDSSERIAWLDRDEVRRRLGLTLAGHEAETENYIFCLCLIDAIKAHDRDARFLDVIDRIIDQAHQLPNMLWGLAAVFVRANETPMRNPAGLLAIVDRTFSRIGSDPNLARLKLRVEDAVRGTGRYAATSAYLSRHRCSIPFKHLETSLSGGVFLCCQAWLPARVGDWHASTTVDALAASPLTVNVRASIDDGSYRYCNWISCPKITSHAVDEEPEPAAYPSEIYLSHDESCNLSCPSCRREVKAAPPSFADDVRSPFLQDLTARLPGAGTVKVTGSGDPFASRYFRRLLRDTHSSNRNLYIHTNALLLNPRAYAALRLARRIRILEISVDAASPGTYHSIRRGGSFDKLLKNLEFVRQLRASGEVPYLQMDFVVQDENFREMDRFVELCRGVGADKIFFSKLRNWHTYTDAEFLSRNVCSALHRHFGELLQMVARPVFAGADVDLGDLPRPAG
jgi:uncharacterized Fe-S cluster-containing radical SAM superfamily protein